MTRKMNAVQVSTDAEGQVVISQEINDPNVHDQAIAVSPDQAVLLASWIVEAASDKRDYDESTETISAEYHVGNPAPDTIEMRVYNNPRGMIVIHLDEDSFVEISPAMAKRMREQLSKAISVAFTDMLRGDAEV